MNTYQVTAQRLGKVKSHTFTDVDDTEATMTAIFYILDQAKTKDMWAKGRIELKNTATNEVLRVMEAKG
jgi:hypothetical protein